MPNKKKETTEISMESYRLASFIEAKKREIASQIKPFINKISDDVDKSTLEEALRKVALSMHSLYVILTKKTWDEASDKDQILGELREQLPDILGKHPEIKSAEEIYNALQSAPSFKFEVTLDDVEDIWNQVMESNPRTRAAADYRSFYPPAHFLAHSTDTMFAGGKGGKKTTKKK